jgi:CubicO group peptidase (beta-lactamase class C family)
VQQEPEVRLQQMVQSYADAQLFMGSVLVAKNGNVVLSKAFGYADLEWSIPNSPTTRFNIASMTKQFTAASILLLEDRGKLKTDDLVKKYLPDAPAVWDKVTIYNLLTHTSGIPDDAAKYEPGTPDRLTFRDKPLDFQPGEKWSYTNLGYIVLGYLLERVSGQTYADFVQENLFKPLGMHDSGLDSNVASIPRRAAGYWPGADGPENAERPNLSLGFSAGSLYSTTEDLLRWEEGLFGGKLLTPASRLVIEHDGNNIGFNSDMAYYPEERLAVIVLGNLNGTVTGEMTKALAAIVHGETVVVSVRKEIALPRKVLARYVGSYQFPGYSMTMTLEGSHLVARFDDGTTILFFAESETKFFSKAWDMQFEFSKNGQDEFTSITRYGIGGDVKGIKK